MEVKGKVGVISSHSRAVSQTNVKYTHKLFMYPRGAKFQLRYKNDSNMKGLKICRIYKCSKTPFVSRLPVNTPEIFNLHAPLFKLRLLKQLFLRTEPLWCHLFDRTVLPLLHRRGPYIAVHFQTGGM